MVKLIKGIIFVTIGLLVLAGVTGCENTTGNGGVHVMFNRAPKIYHPEVYHRGRVVGAIQAQESSNGSASRVTIRIDPQFRQFAGKHWAFYVDNGRLTASRLNSSGRAVKPGDRVCGFNSKAALNWFKVKTLLRNRISEAGRRAEKLHRRFTS